MNQEFIAGCEAAKLRLASTYEKGKSNRDYRRGWNSYNGTATPAPAAGSQAPTVDQGAPQASPDADAEAVRRLNEQELKRMKGR
jgi:hypothetical protein